MAALPRWRKGGGLLAGVGDDDDLDEATPGTGTASAGGSRARPVADRCGSIPERLNHLFETLHPPGRKPYSAAEAARVINDPDGEIRGKISAVYILKILGGERPDPSPRYLKQLAQFFGVSLAVFWDDDPPELDPAALNRRLALRGATVRDMMVRASMLSPRSQEALSDIIDSLLKVEGRTPPPVSDG